MKMRNGICVFTAAWLAIGVVCGAGASVPDPETVFRNPPQSAKTGVWWHWMGSNVTREGIVKDLDWFKGGLKARPSKGRKCFTGWNCFTKDSKLVPSGLPGPVGLRSLPATGKGGNVRL